MRIDEGFGIMNSSLSIRGKGADGEPCAKCPRLEKAQAPEYCQVAQ